MDLVDRRSQVDVDILRSVAVGDVPRMNDAAVPEITVPAHVMMLAVEIGKIAV